MSDFTALAALTSTGGEPIGVHHTYVYTETSQTDIDTRHPKVRAQRQQGCFFLARFKYVRSPTCPSNSMMLAAFASRCMLLSHMILFYAL
jgi:hypothetical protein